MTEESNVLFMRGSGNKSEDEDIWDDTVLVQAYDKAVNLAKEEVAKRIAMDIQDQQAKQTLPNSKYSNHIRKPSKKWTVGSPCRAVYSVDGKVYEAVVSNFHQNGMCTVKFVGYQNTETVKINSLLESEGLQSQIAQHKAALAQEANEEVVDSNAYSDLRDSRQINGEKMDCDSEDSRLFKNNFMPGLGYFNPTLDAMPPAPPFPPLMAKLPETDADALSSMLMSWYVSGFHTGYYHGLKQAKIKQQQRRNCQ